MFHVVQQRLGRRKPGWAYAQAPRHALGNEFGSGEGGKLDKADAILEVFSQLGGGLQRESRLATTARTGERQQPARGHHPLQFVELPLASHEAADLYRQVAPRAGTGLRFLLMHDCSSSLATHVLRPRAARSAPQLVRPTS